MTDTLLVVKPQATERGLYGEIETIVREHGFSVIAKRFLKLTQKQAEEHYTEHRGKSHFERNVEYISSGEVVALWLRKENAIEDLRKLIGPTFVKDAKQLSYFTIRGTFGSENDPLHCNVVHASDSRESFDREIGIFFKEQK